MNDFDFCRPTSLAETFEAVSRPGRIVPIAGGTNVMVNLKRAPLEADWVVDLTGIDDLRDIEEDGDVIRLGAGVTLARLLEWHPGGGTEKLLQPMASQFAGPLIRNLATVGGNLCDASPAADVSPPLLVLEASVKLESARGSRLVPLEDFFLGVRRTVRRPDEILSTIEIPRPDPAARTFYYKLGKRKADAISVVSVAMKLEMNSGVIEEARIALGAVAPVAMRARSAEEILKGERPTASLLSSAASAAASESRPIDDFRASAAYRREMVETLVLRGLRRASA
jgi:carbon-monoxide dehydrogenase medium subunit